MKVCVIGLGYIGLPTAAMLARNGHEILGVDISEDTLRFIRERGASAEEPGLAELVLGAVSSGALQLAPGPEAADAFILCLPTPVNPDRTPDLSFVESGMRGILPFLSKGNMVILESTVPPGTVRGLCADLARGAGLDPVEDLDMVFAPERVIPGNIVHEIQNLDRVMGGLTPRAAERARDLYSSFVRGNIILTDATTAEFVKLVENSYRDVNIAFANELAKICPGLGINVWEVISIANRHPRVNIHSPGPGVGGHCIAVDPYFIIDSAPDLARLLSVAREVNSSMPMEAVRVLEGAAGDLKGKKVALLGIAYKADVGDFRESPSLEVAHILGEMGASVAAHDPFVKKAPMELVGLEEALRGADAVIISTNHTAFRSMDPAWAGKLVRCKMMLDARGMLDRAAWKNAGWKVLALGDGKTGI